MGKAKYDKVMVELRPDLFQGAEVSEHRRYQRKAKRKWSYYGLPAPVVS